MYLTRMELDASRRKTSIALATPEMLHGAVESSFSGPRQRRMWRVDKWQGRYWLLILSEDKPDLASASAQFAPAGATWETKDFDVLLHRIKNGGSWQFRLCANPTYSIARPNARGRVCAHTTAAHQKKWLIEQGGKHGFSVTEDEFDIVQTQWYSFSKGKDKHKVRMLGVTYEGILHVTDAEIFCRALCDGIGREKAYGMGLMTLMRAEG